MYDTYKNNFEDAKFVRGKIGTVTTNAENSR